MGASSEMHPPISRKYLQFLASSLKTPKATTAWRRNSDLPISGKQTKERLSREASAFSATGTFH
ncbi:hypothetical protein FKM82_027410 [Ascaphus truei]